MRLQAYNPEGSMGIIWDEIVIIFYVIGKIIPSPPKKYVADIIIIGINVTGNILCAYEKNKAFFRTWKIRVSGNSWLVIMNMITSQIFGN